MITGYWADGTIYPNTNCFLRAADGAITTFNPPGAITSNCLAINNDGVIAGYYCDLSNVCHGFLRAADGTITTIDVPGAGTGFYQGTTANAINQAGTITGYYQDASGVSHGFLRAADGTLTPFDPPNSQNTYPGTINPAGEIAGYFCDLVGCHGFLRAAKGTFTTIDPPGTVYTFGLPNNDQVPVGINPAAAITGTYIDQSFQQHGFLRTP